MDAVTRSPPIIKCSTTRNDDRSRLREPPSGPPRSGWVQPVAGANRRWRWQFRCRGSRRRSAVAQHFSLGHLAAMPVTQDQAIQIASDFVQRQPGLCRGPATVRHERGGCGTDRLGGVFKFKKVEHAMAKTVYVSSSLHEKILSVSSIGSALGADKKNHLTVEFFDNVHGAAATRASTKRSSAYGRGDGVCAARGLSVARLALGLWSLEFGVHPLAALVSVRIVGATVGVVGTAGPRQVALSGRQPCQSASRRQPSCGRPTKSGHRTTKGGLNTKVNAWVDGRGRAVSLSLAPGQPPDVCVAQTAARLPLRGTITVADKGYDSDGFREQLRRWGSRSCIPPRCNRLTPVAWHRGHYRRRHQVENLFQRLKRYRRIGTRYDKLDLYFLGFVQFAAVWTGSKTDFENTP